MNTHPANPVSAAHAGTAAFQRLRRGAARAARLLACLVLVAGCDSEPAATPTDAGNGGQSAAGYAPFSLANLQSQQARVGAYSAIGAIRKAASFSAADFGDDCTSWSPAATESADPTKIASLYIETASLAAKVAGRKDDHAWNVGAAIGAEIHADICAAIGAGSKTDAATAKDAVGGIGWHAQVVDKSLQHFFYQSVFHELSAGARKNWDEAVGYFGADLGGDPAKAQGIAATTRSRDSGCKTTYHASILAKMKAGAVALDAALTAAGKTGNEDALVPLPADVQGIVDDVDRMLREVFALSVAHELIELKAGDNPTIKLIEARMYWRILEPFVLGWDADHGTSHAATIAAELDKDAAASLDPDAVLAGLEAVFALNAETICD